MADPQQFDPDAFMAERRQASGADFDPDTFMAERKQTPRVGGQKVLDYANETLSNIPSSAGKFLGNMYQAVRHPIDTGESVAKIITGTAQKMTPGYVTPQRPGYSKEAEAAGAALKERYGSLPAIANTIKTDPVGAAADVAAVATGVGGLARSGARLAATSAPRVASTLGDVANVANKVEAVSNPLTVPLKAAGAIPKSMGRGFVRSALPGLGGRTERYGATPAQAILEETKSIRPGPLKDEIRGVLNDLDSQLDAVTSAAERRGATPDLTKARQVLIDKINEVKRANGLTGDLDPMLEQLTSPRPGFAGATEYPAGAQTPIKFKQTSSPVLGPSGQPIMGTPQAVKAGPSPDPVISAKQKPTNYLEMQRKFQPYTKFDYAVPLSSPARSLGNQAYHALSSEFNRAVPEAVPIKQRMQSLIPGEQAAQRADELAGPVERSVNRVTRPTGAMAASLFGLHEAGLPGMVGAMTVQEALASPAARMALARLFYSGGKVTSAPLTRRVLTGLGVEGEAGTPDPRFNLRGNE